MKRIISTAAVLTLSCAFIPSLAFAANSGECGENAKWEFSQGTLTVSGTGNIQNGKQDWYDFAEDVKSIVVEDGITDIGDGAFGNCKNAKSAVIPESVNRIGAYAFASCESIESMDLPSKLETIATGAFARCSKLAEINVPETVKTIGANAFSQTAWLDNCSDEYLIVGDGILYSCNSTEKQITVPDEVKTIGAYAFASNKLITSVNTNKASYIGDAAFMDCTALLEVVLGEGTEEVDDAAFKNCAALSKIDIPASVKTIGKEAFYGCTALSEISFPETETVDTGMFMNSSALSDFETPSSVTSIGESAFSGTGIKYIEIPESVKTIGFNAFKDCDKLTDVIYMATPTQWDFVEIDEGNEALTNAVMTYIDNYKIKVNGKYVSMEQKPFMKNDHTVVPVRVISEALDAKVDWDGDNMTAIVVKGDTTIRITIDSDVMYKDDEPITLETPALIKDDRTYLPVRAVAEALDAEVDWDGDNMTVFINTK